jgi:hypothetical protein
LPEAEVAAITEQLSGSCTTEIASFNEFTALLADADGVTDRFDYVLFDTAPTGHTIRLLQLPGSWTDFLAAGTGDASCLGPLSGLEKQRDIYAAAVHALADPLRTRLVLVSRAQTSTLAEIARTHTELAAIGLSRQHVVINGVLPAPVAGDDPLGDAIFAREQAAIAAMPAKLRALPTDSVELKATNLVGLEALRTMFQAPSPAGSSIVHFLVAFAGEDRAGVPAAHGYHNIGCPDDLVGPRLRVLAGDVDATLAHDLDRGGVDRVTGFGARPTKRSPRRRRSAGRNRVPSGNGRRCGCTGTARPACRRG